MLIHINKSLLVLFVILFAACANGKQNNIDLFVYNNIKITKATVSVADVVDVSILESEIIERLSHINLTKSPLPGYSKSLSRMHIAKAVRNQKNRQFIHINVVGSEKVKIVRESKIITSKYYINKARELFSEYLGNTISDVQLVAVGKNKDIHVPNEDIKINLSVENLKHTSSRMCAMIDISANGVFFTRLPVWFKVSGKYPAYILNRSITKGEVLNKSMLVSKQFEISGKVTELSVDLSTLDKFVAKRLVKKGQLLTDDVLTHKMDVIRGNTVNVIVEVGNVTLYTNAIAKQSGSVGEIVELINKKNNETYKGIVINENYVSSL